MPLNEADVTKRNNAYDGIETQIKCATDACINILRWSRQIASHRHSNERERVKKLIGEFAELSIIYKEGKDDNLKE